METGVCIPTQFFQDCANQTKHIWGPNSQQVLPVCNHWSSAQRHTHAHSVCVLGIITLPFSPMVVCAYIFFQTESERVKNKKEYRLSSYIVQTGRIQRTQLLLKEKELLYPYSLIVKIISGQHFELCPHLHPVSTKTTTASRTVTLPSSSSSNQRGTFPAQKRLWPFPRAPLLSSD